MWKFLKKLDEKYGEKRYESFENIIETVFGISFSWETKETSRDDMWSSLYFKISNKYYIVADRRLDECIDVNRKYHKFSIAKVVHELTEEEKEHHRTHVIIKEL